MAYSVPLISQLGHTSKILANENHRTSESGLTAETRSCCLKRGTVPKRWLNIKAVPTILSDRFDDPAQQLVVVYNVEKMECKEIAMIHRSSDRHRQEQLVINEFNRYDRHW